MDVLRRVHESLRIDGLLLVMQPAPANATIQMEIENSSGFKEEFKEPNFLRYLKATDVAIRSVLGERLFAVENEATTPQRNEYASIDEWVEDRTSFCEDQEAFAALQAEMRSLASGREHRVFEYWKEYEILLHKSEPR
jgi:hypothetical protein